MKEEMIFHITNTLIIWLFFVLGFILGKKSKRVKENERRNKNGRK